VSEYTPTTEQMREDCGAAAVHFLIRKDVALERFDRWLRQVKAEAWDEGFSAGETMAGSYGHTDWWESSNLPPNPYLGGEGL